MAKGKYCKEEGEIKISFSHLRFFLEWRAVGREGLDLTDMMKMWMFISQRSLLSTKSRASDLIPVLDSFKEKSESWLDSHTRNRLNITHIVIYMITRLFSIWAVMKHWRAAQTWKLFKERWSIIPQLRRGGRGNISLNHKRPPHIKTFTLLHSLAQLAPNTLRLRWYVSCLDIGCLESRLWAFPNLNMDQPLKDQTFERININSLCIFLRFYFQLFQLYFI